MTTSKASGLEENSVYIIIVRIYKNVPDYNTIYRSSAVICENLDSRPRRASIVADVGVDRGLGIMVHDVGYRVLVYCICNTAIWARNLPYDS